MVANCSRAASKIIGNLLRDDPLGGEVGAFFQGTVFQPQIVQVCLWLQLKQFVALIGIGTPFNFLVVVNSVAGDQQKCRVCIR